MIFCNQPKSFYEFKALVLVYNHTTTIRPGYTCVLHCGLVRQAIKITEIKSDILRSRETSMIRCRFISHPEYLEENTRFMIREGNTIGLGIIKELVTN